MTMKLIALVALCLAALFASSEAHMCKGYRSCKSKSMTSHNYCYGYQSCIYARPSSKGYSTMCYGYQSCYQLRMSRALYGGNVICGFHGCYNAYVYTTNAYAYGHIAFHAAQVYTYRVYAYGSYGMHSAHVRALHKYLAVTVSGYHSGYNMRMYCYAGDTCHLSCSQTACQHTYFYCYNHANCHLHVSTASYPPRMVGGNGNKQISDEEIEQTRKLNEAKLASAAAKDTAGHEIAGLAGKFDVDEDKAQLPAFVGAALGKDAGSDEFADENDVMASDAFAGEIGDEDEDENEAAGMGFGAFEQAPFVSQPEFSGADSEWTWSAVLMVAVLCGVFLSLLACCMYKYGARVWAKLSGNAKYHSISANSQLLA